jgi:hypothetical protein
VKAGVNATVVLAPEPGPTVGSSALAPVVELDATVEDAAGAVGRAVVVEAPAVAAFVPVGPLQPATARANKSPTPTARHAHRLLVMTSIEPPSPPIPAAPAHRVR